MAWPAWRLVQLAVQTMASITRRGQRWRAQVRRRGHRPLSGTFATKREAAAWARKVEQDLAAGLEVSTRSFADAVDAYLETDRGHELSAHERNCLAWWRARLGHRRLHDLRRPHFYEARDAMRGRRGQHLARATRNRRTALASAVLSYARDLEWLPGNPAQIPRLTEDNLVEHHVTRDELQRLLEACRQGTEPCLAAFVLAALSSGARAGELRGLRWQDVDLEEGLAGLLRTKTRKRRPAPIRGSALQELRRMYARHRSEGGTDAAYIFRHRNGRAPFNHSRAWRRARLAIGRPELRFHDLRHAVASSLAAAGHSQRELMALLGHTNPATTARYAHLLDRHIGKLGDEAAAALLPEEAPQ